MKIDELAQRVSIVPIIEEAFTLRQSGQHYLRGVEHDSLVVDIRKNKFYWNSLGISGGPITWLMQIRGLSYRHALDELQRFSGLPFREALLKIDKPTPIYPRLLDTFFELGKRNRSYWYSRGFTDDSIDKFKLGFTGKANVIPIIQDGVLENFQCRIGQGAEKRVWWWAKHKALNLFGADDLRSSYVVLTEGPIDAITLHQVGIPAITQSAINYWNNLWNKYLVDCYTIYILYDNDLAGRTAARKIVKRFLNRGKIAYWPSFLPEKFDVNDGLIQFGEDTLKKLLTEIIFPYSVYQAEENDTSYIKERDEAARKIL